MDSTVPISLLVGFLVPAASRVAEAYRYEVRGVVEQAQLEAGLEKPLRRESTFTVSVDDSRWFIRLVPKDWPSLSPIIIGTNQAVPLVPSYFEGGSDGESFYRVMAFPDFGAGPKPRNKGIAARGPGTVPFAVGDEIIALWYLFASHCYLATVTNMLNAPMESLPIDLYKEGVFEVPGAILRDGSPPGLPRAASTVGYLVKNEQEGIRLAAVPLSLTNVHLYVAAFTNQYGLSIPVDASVDYFRIRGRTEPYHVVPHKRMRVQVESLAGDCRRTNFVPEVPQPSTITDLGVFAKAKRSALVFGTNWLPQEELLERAEAARPRSAQIQRLSPVFLIVICALMLVPAVSALISKALSYRKSPYEKP